MEITQEYQNLNLMVQDAFGSGDVNSKSNEPQPKIVQTEADLMGFMQAFN